MSVSRINISTLSSQFLNALQIIFLFHHVSHLRESWKELRSCYQSQLGLYDKSLLVVYYSPPFKYINTLTEGGISRCHLRESWKELRSCYQSQLGLYDKSLLVVYYSPPFKYINTLTVLILHSLVISRRSLIPSSEGKLIFCTIWTNCREEKSIQFGLC